MSKYPKYDFRDVSLGLKKLRDFLLGRKHNLHGRFPPLLAPRSIPQPEIPRGPEYKYSDQYYCKRNAYDSVKPPVVAPVAEGPPLNRDPTKEVEGGGVNPDAVCFAYPPTPGLAWWWDGHCYYECVPDSPFPPCPPCPPSAPCPPCPPCPPSCAPPGATYYPPPDPCPSDPCTPPTPPCPLSPDKMPKH